MANKNGLIDLSKLKKMLFEKKGTTILMVVGLIGIALILLSEMWPSSAGKSTASTSSDTITASQYAQQTEKQLSDVVSQINGVGRVKVMVTVESGVEYVYEQDVKDQNDKNQNSSDGGTQLQENSSSEEQPVLIENDSGGQKALIKTEIQPIVKGVVVVCDGGDDPTVVESITDTVSTALDLSANHISVSKMKNGK